MESRNVKSKTTNILERPLSRGKSDVSLSSFAFLFSEYVQVGAVVVVFVNFITKIWNWCRDFLLRSEMIMMILWRNEVSETFYL